MPASAHNRSLSIASSMCRRGLTDSPYTMKYGFAASSSAPPRSSHAIRHMTSRSSRSSAVTTMGLVVLFTMARKLCRKASAGRRSLGHAPDMTKSMLGSASHSRAARTVSSRRDSRKLPRLKVPRGHEVGAAAEVRSCTRRDPSPARLAGRRP